MERVHTHTHAHTHTHTHAHTFPPRLPDIARAFQAYAKFGHDRADLFIPLARWAARV